MLGSETTIRAIDALRCIRSGMSETMLMERFNLSASALRSLLSQLIAAGILRESEIYARTSLSPGSVVLDEDLKFEVPRPAKKPVIDAAEALRCIRMDIDDAGIMARFEITHKGLQSLFKKLIAAGAVTQEDLDKRSAKLNDFQATEERLSERRLNREELADDIRSGMEDAVLMRKYALSQAQLRQECEALMKEGLLDAFDQQDRSVVKPLIPFPAKPIGSPLQAQKKPKIDAANALASIRAGDDDATLMTKYSISARGLESLFSKLVAAGAITREELEKRLLKSYSMVIVDEGVYENKAARKKTGMPNLDVILDALKSMPTHEAIMERFNLTSRELTGLCEALVTREKISREELDHLLFRNSASLEIRHRTSGEVIYKSVERSVGALVEKAVREGVDLSEAELAGFNLARRDLSGARMVRANLHKAILVGADLSSADLSGAMLKSADFYGASLQKANLASADLSDSNLMAVNAIWAFMPNINLAEANLSNADFTGSNLAGANFFESIVNETKFDGAYLVGAQMEYVRKGNDKINK